jgi:putative intracellular protease/amidase
MSEVGPSQVVADHHMRVDRTDSRPRKVLIVVANPATSTTLGWPAVRADLTLSDGSYLVDGKTVTGFSNVEEEFSDTFVGEQVMPWRVEDVLRQRGANYVQAGLFKAFAVRDGRLITGQQQYSGRKVAQMVIEALGV